MAANNEMAVCRKTALNKFRNGDGLSDDELDDLLSLYSRLDEDLRWLGPEFRLAWSEVLRCKMSLESFKQARMQRGEKRR